MSESESELSSIRIDEPDVLSPFNETATELSSIRIDEPDVLSPFNETATREKIKEISKRQYDEILQELKELKAKSEIFTEITSILNLKADDLEKITNQILKSTELTVNIGKEKKFLTDDEANNLKDLGSKIAQNLFLYSNELKMQELTKTPSKNWMDLVIDNTKTFTNYFCKNPLKSLKTGFGMGICYYSKEYLTNFVLNKESFLTSIASKKLPKCTKYKISYATNTLKKLPSECAPLHFDVLLDMISPENKDYINSMILHLDLLYAQNRLYVKQLIKTIIDSGMSKTEFIQNLIYPATTYIDTLNKETAFSILLALLSCYGIYQYYLQNKESIEKIKKIEKISSSNKVLEQLFDYKIKDILPEYYSSSKRSRSELEDELEKKLDDIKNKRSRSGSDLGSKRKSNKTCKSFKKFTTKKSSFEKSSSVKSKNKKNKTRKSRTRKRKSRIRKRKSRTRKSKSRTRKSKSNGKSRTRKNKSRTRKSKRKSKSNGKNRSRHSRQY